MDIAARVREELARHRRSRQWLADAARVSLSTLEKSLAGSRPFTLATVLRIEQALGISLRAGETASAAPSGLAPEALGAYARGAVAWLEGRYIMLRPSAGEPGSVYAHMLTIAWDQAAGALAFAESERTDADYTQEGQVGVSSLSGHIYLVTNDLGQYRLAVLGRPARTGELYGLLTSLQVGQGAALLPVAMPLALLPAREEALPVGRISPGHPAFTAYKAQLDRVLAEGFAKLYS